jgi:hypothetical protein
MRLPNLKRVAVLAAVLLLLPVGLYWLADAWLESSGGRQMLEEELGARFEMSVRLEGEFDLMLLPDIGVSGTELVIGGEAGEGEFFANSQGFEVSVALKPLFDRQVVVEWIRLTGGRVYPGRYSRFINDTGSAATQLPEIRELDLRDFEIVLSEDDASSLRVKELTVRDFAGGRRAAFSLDIEDLVEARGWLLWDTAQSAIQLGDVQLDLAGQKLSGQGCLMLGEFPSLNVELEARTFDFDAFRSGLPAMGQSGAGQSGGDLPLDIRIRFKVDELRSSGVFARGVVLSLGRDPVCE